MRFLLALAASTRFLHPSQAVRASTVDASDWQLHLIHPASPSAHWAKIFAEKPPQGSGRGRAVTIAISPERWDDVSVSVSSVHGHLALPSKGAVSTPVGRINRTGVATLREASPHDTPRSKGSPRDRAAHYALGWLGRLAGEGKVRLDEAAVADMERVMRALGGRQRSRSPLREERVRENGVVAGQRQRDECSGCGRKRKAVPRQRVGMGMLVSE